MSKRGQILHRQTFQNSNSIVELTVKTIPKDLPQGQISSNSHPPFIRDCALKKELQKVADKKNNNIVVDKNLLRKPATAQAKNKNPGGRVTVEVSKKKTRRRHDIVPRNNTWEDVLRNCSTITTIDESDVADPAPCARREQLLENRRPLNHDRRWHQKTPDMDESDTPELIVNQQIQSGETSPQEFRPHYINLNAREHNGAERERGSDHRDRRRLRIPLPRAQHSHLNNNRAQEGSQNAQLNQHLEQSKQTKGSATNRLLSDDVNASPFGESALQLLRQLKERLQSRGDSEAMDIVGAVEAFISGQGSMGGIGASNVPQSASTASPVYAAVFPTPVNNMSEPCHNQPYDQTRPRQNQYTYGPYMQHGQPYHNPEEFHPQVIQGLPVQVRENGHNPSYHQTQFTYGPHAQIVNPEQIQTEHQHQSVPSSDLCDVLRNRQDTQEINHKTDGSSQQQQEQIHQKRDESLKREIAKQQKIIAEQESDLLQLKTLSTRLIAQQEQLALQAQEEAKKRNEELSGNSLSRRETQAKECQTEECLGEEPTRDRDSSTSASSVNKSDRDYRSTLLLLKTENEILHREVRSHRDLILNLENQLTKVYVELDSERRSRAGMSLSRLSGSAPNLDFSGNRSKETVPEKLAQSKPPSNHGESEVDSAYEEKTSSRLTSKVGSPHLEKQDGHEPVTGTSGVSSLPLNEKDLVTGVHHSDETGSHHNLGHATPNHDANVPSINRNVTLSSNLLPVSYSGLPSMEFCNSNGNSQTSITSRLNHHITDIQRAPVMETATRSDNPKGATAKISKFNSQIALLINDIELNQGKVMDSPSFPSFSTVSEDSHQEGTTNQENSFLRGISLPKCNSGIQTFSRDSNVSTISDIRNPTMESTRVQENTPPQGDTRSSMEPSFQPLKESKTFTSTILSTVDKLQ